MPTNAPASSIIGAPNPPKKVSIERSQFKRLMRPASSWRWNAGYGAARREARKALPAVPGD
jgi:hypothetical protein